MEFERYDFVAEAHQEKVRKEHPGIILKNYWNSFTVLPKMDNEKEQVLLLAGDIVMIALIDRFTGFFQEISERFKQVIVIQGNHERYRYDFTQSTANYREFLKQWENITLLEKEFTVVDDVVVFGATLWTDFNKEDAYAMFVAGQGMSDFRVITVGNDDAKRHFTPEDSVLEFKDTVDYLDTILFSNRGKYRKTVVMTHHLPSSACNDERFAGSPLNPAFSSDSLNDFLDSGEIDLWVCGHTHCAKDVKVLKTRIIINPRGYPGEDTNFNGKLVVEI